MRAKLFYFFDQLLFSVFGFILFLILERRFPAADVAEYSVMISGSAFLLNLGFAVMIERLLGQDDKYISFYDFLVLVLLIALASGSIYFLLWIDYAHGLSLALAMFITALVWLIRRICVLEVCYVRHSMAVTSVSGLASLTLAWQLSRFDLFLAAYCLIYACATLYLSRLSIRRREEGLWSSLHRIVGEPGRLVRSLLLVPLLWLPSNGIYLVLSFFGSASVMIETRKLLMLLSPIQQFSVAMINYIFSKGKRYTSSHVEMYVLPVAITIAVTPVCAVVYNKLLQGANTEFALWFAFALIVVCMLIISLTQSILRVQGHQSIVIAALTLTAIVKMACLLAVKGYAGGIDLVSGFISMAAAYCAGALVLGAVYASKYKIV